MVPNTWVAFFLLAFPTFVWQQFNNPLVQSLQERQSSKTTNNNIATIFTFDKAYANITR